MGKCLKKTDEDTLLSGSSIDHDGYTSVMLCGVMSGDWQWCECVQGPTTPLENECVAKEILSVSGYGDGDGSVRAMMMS